MERGAGLWLRQITEDILFKREKSSKTVLQKLSLSIHTIASEHQISCDFNVHKAFKIIFIISFD